MAPTFEGKPGDLIEIFRGAYNHWAVYIGENEVVHLTILGGGPSGSSSNRKKNPSSSSNGIVKRDKLSDVVGNDHYHINNLLDNSRKPQDPSFIVEEACEMVGRKLHYNVVKYNCEHFATEMRYGKAESRQVKAVPSGAVASLVTGGPVVALGVLVVGLYAFCKGLFRSRSSR